MGLELGRARLHNLREAIQRVHDAVRNGHDATGRFGVCGPRRAREGSSAKVCGMCGILSDSSSPTGGSITMI